MDREVTIFPDATTLSRAAATQFASLATTAVTARSRFIVALAGGSTPQELYRLLRQPPYVDTIPWKQTYFFWGDERLVPPQNEGSNYRQAAEILLDHVPVPPAHVHRIEGELQPAAAVASYKQALRRLADEQNGWPRFDLALMGMGSDGHTASLFPGPISVDEAHSPVIATTADYDGRPAHRVTLTPLVFNDARHLLFLVTGEQKADAVAAVLRGPHRPQQWPAQRIQPHDGTVTWFIDQAAASKLETKNEP